MSEVTIKTILDGVTSSLSTAFPEVEVRDNVQEAVASATPYFMVNLSAASQNQELNRRYNCSYSFTIQYIPTKDQPSGTVHEYAQQLYEVFREIEIDGANYHGRNMRHEMVKGILNFHFDFRFLIWLPSKDEPRMQALKEEGRLKA